MSKLINLYTRKDDFTVYKLYLKEYDIKKTLSPFMVILLIFYFVGRCGRKKMNFSKSLHFSEVLDVL